MSLRLDNKQQQQHAHNSAYKKSKDNSIIKLMGRKYTHTHTHIINGWVGEEWSKANTQDKKGTENMMRHYWRGPLHGL